MADAQLLRLAVFDELVWPANANYRHIQLHFVQGFHNAAAEASHEHVILKGDNRCHLLGVSLKHFVVKRLDVAGIDYGGGESLEIERLREFFRHGKHAAESKYRNIL